MRMVSSPGKSIRSRRAICSGLHALPPRRGCRPRCRRLSRGTTAPRTAALPEPPTSPASLSCTYPRSAAFTASFAGFGRRAARSACHCAVVARYSRPPLRVAALRRSSREIVDAARPSRRAVSRTPQPRARNSASSSRSANDRYRSDGGFADGANILGDMPPASRNQRAPTAGDTPTSIAAASLDRPAAIAAQNRRRLSRCATPGRPGDRGNTARSARSERRLPALIATPSVKVLRRPLEPTRREPGILMNVHPVLRGDAEASQLQLPRSEPDGQPNESSHLVDRVQIQQVLVNLIRNAAEAMEESPRRVITMATAAQEPGLIEISVADTGL